MHGETCNSEKFSFIANTLRTSFISRILFRLSHLSNGFAAINALMIAQHELKRIVRGWALPVSTPTTSPLLLADMSHNRAIPDGIGGLVGYVQAFAKRYPDYTYDVKHIFAAGDHVIFHSHATMRKADRSNDKRGFNIIDTWEIEDAAIVEHWDAVQPFDGFIRFYLWLTGGSIHNANGVFQA